MGFINLADKTINAKLVYYGVGVGGKTTSLQAVHRIMCPRDEVKLVSIKTEEDSTLLFDFLPINLGQVEGFKIRIQGFTVPGQPKYRLMRKYVLSGADAVVFVVDSQRSRLDENLQALESLKENLRHNGIDADKVPLVLQYNKRDLADILPEDELDRHFRFRAEIQSFPSVATEEQGVFETFVHAAGLLVEAKVQLYGLGRSGTTVPGVAQGARNKLWELHDQTRGAESDRRNRAQVLAVRVPEVGAAVAEQTAVVMGDSTKIDTDAIGPNGASGKQVELTDTELSAPLDLERVRASENADQEHAQADERLLDRAVQSNLVLVESISDLERQKFMLEQKVGELVKIAQNTVHDLNRPLSVIKLLLSTIHKGYLGEVPTQIRDAIDNGLLATHQMERLIEELLDSSRIDYNGIKLEFGDVDVTLLAASVVRSIRQIVEESDAVIQIEPLPVVRADEWALTKVFMNLIGNALQYRHPERRPRINVSAIAEADRWRFTVKDNGIGIPTGDTNRLFQRFERGSNTQGISGSGLGLHIVREVILGHGGDIWIESKEDQGTSFHFGLPFVPQLAPHSNVSNLLEAADR